MKSANSLSKKIIGGSFLAVGFSFSNNAIGQIIYINDLNPAAVRIYSTGGIATASSSTTDINDGADLLGFFPTSAPGGYTQITPSVTNLTGPVSSAAYNISHPDDVTSVGSYVDFNVYYQEPPENGTDNFTSQDFVANTPAFSGSLTLNLSAYVTDLPAQGATGNVIAGYSGYNSGGEYTGPGHTGVVIGEWEVISGPPPAPSLPAPPVLPEPSTWTLVLGGLGLLGLFRRRVRQA
jgi:hypothetical protein